MSDIESYKNLKVWQLSMDLVAVCFDIVDALPQSHRFIFSNQLLPAAISIPSNISEGSRRARKSYLYHLSVSLGSHGELETLLEIMRRRSLVPAPLISKGFVLAETVGKMLHGLVRSFLVHVRSSETIGLAGAKTAVSTRGRDSATAWPHPSVELEPVLERAAPA